MKLGAKKCGLENPYTYRPIRRIHPYTSEHHQFHTLRLAKMHVAQELPTFYWLQVAGVHK